jgi:hypothetical protein
MNQKSAMKMARKHGVVVQTMEQGACLYTLDVSPIKKVTWRIVKETHGPTEWVCQVRFWWSIDRVREPRIWESWGVKTLAAAICQAKNQRLDQKGVRIEVSYRGQGINRRIVVWIGDSEVCGGDPSLEGMALAAIEMGEVRPLRDWVEEHELDRCPGVILI